MERAIIFFISVSFRALAPAIREVNAPKIIIAIKFNLSLNRIIIKTPAVTNVLEWTKAEIGVGALIARGSQDVRGA